MLSQGACGAKLSFLSSTWTIRAAGGLTSKWTARSRRYSGSAPQKGTARLALHAAANRGDRTPSLVSARRGELASRSVQEPSVKLKLDDLRMKAGLWSGRWSQSGSAPALGDKAWSRHNDSVELPDKPNLLVTTILLHRDGSLARESCSNFEESCLIGALLLALFHFSPSRCTVRSIALASRACTLWRTSGFKTRRCPARNSWSRPSACTASRPSKT